MKKGQLSMEYLLLLLVFLAVLSISVFSLSKAKISIEGGLEKALAQSLLSDISYKAEDACILGEGNVRIARTKLEGFSLSKEEGKISFARGPLHVSEEMPCEFEVSPGEYGKETVVEMREGRILVYPG